MWEIATKLELWWNRKRPFVRHHLEQSSVHLQKTKQTASITQLNIESIGIRTQVFQRSRLVRFIHQPLYHSLANGQTHSSTHLRNRCSRIAKWSHEWREFRINTLIAASRQRYRPWQFTLWLQVEEVCATHDPQRQNTRYYCRHCIL